MKTSHRLQNAEIKPQARIQDKARDETPSTSDTFRISIVWRRNDEQFYPISIY